MEKAGSGNIYIGLGANLPHPRHGSPKATLEAALVDLEGRGLQVLRLSPWYRTAPVPASDQPWFVNAVAELATDWPADRLLAALHEVEEAFGRLPPGWRRRSDFDAAGRTVVTIAPTMLPSSLKRYAWLSIATALASTPLPA